jgi:ArsR family transcriptional regulator, virulence genes transcriptional regulator
MKKKSSSHWRDLTQSCEITAKILKALAHPHRLQILCHLTSDEKTVGELESLCGASQSAVSQFLGRMKSEGLVSSERDGLFVKYRIADPRILRTIKSLQRIFCDE